MKNKFLEFSDAALGLSRISRDQWDAWPPVGRCGKFLRRARSILRTRFRRATRRSGSARPRSLPTNNRACVRRASLVQDPSKWTSLNHGFILIMTNQVNEKLPWLPIFIRAKHQMRELNMAIYQMSEISNARTEHGNISKVWISFRSIWSIFLVDLDFGPLFRCEIISLWNLAIYRLTNNNLRIW